MKFINCFLVMCLMCGCFFNSKTRLPQNKLKVLFYKEVDNARWSIGFNGKKLATLSKKGVVIESDLQSNATREYNFSKWCKSENAHIAGYADDKLLATCGPQLLKLDMSSSSAPEELYKFKKDLKWIEENDGRLLIYSEDSEFGYFESGKLKSKGYLDDAFAKSNLDEIEISQESFSSSSALSLKTNEKCEISQQGIVGFGRVSSSKLGYAFEGRAQKTENLTLLGIDCEKKTPIWKSTINSELFHLNNSINLENLVTHTCGENICINIYITENWASPPQNHSGVICFKSISGEQTFHSINKFNYGDYERNTLAPMICDDKKVVVFRNSSPFVLSQDLTTKSDSFKTYLTEDAIKKIEEVARQPNKALSSAALIPIDESPKISKGRIVLVIDQKHFFVLGE